MPNEREGFVEHITPRSQDFSQWYIDVILKAELADYAPVRGCMVIRPYGFGIWENMQAALDRRIRDTGHQNAYFPLFIPESLLRKEAEHVEGFAPEVAWVTHGGAEELAERLVVRPTSETIICSMYAKWIQSWRDLPVLINQWANVVRWEKTTRFFLRTTEFLWQEGHTAHATQEEAQEETLKMLRVYRDFAEEDLAIPVIPGQKTESEKFAGALRTYSIEALMGDARALQAGTSHNLGQNFARVFDITYLDRDNQLKYIWQTSWGVSTRLMGALIMVHGDERGLALPPKIAPTQVIIVPIMPPDSRETVLQNVREITRRLSPRFRVKVDDREEYSPGWKFNEWELRGVPLRLEIGPRDVKANKAVLVPRHSGKKLTVDQANIEAEVERALMDVQKGLYDRAREFLENNTHDVATFEEFKEIMETKRGFLRAPWCGDAECEARIKEETGATIRCIPLSSLGIDLDAVPLSPVFATEMQSAGSIDVEPAPPEEKPCILCGKEPTRTVYFARAY